MKPLGIDLGKLAADVDPLSGAPDCPGGLVRVMRHDLAQLKAGGEVFQTSAQAIPADGYGSARVACRNQVEPLADPISGSATYYGLCRSCSQLEADNRAMLRERQKAREGGR